jgi:hypothetical protein
LVHGEVGGSGRMARARGHVVASFAPGYVWESAFYWAACQLALT